MTFNVKLKKTAENAISDVKELSLNLMLNLKCHVKFAITKLQLTNHF